MANKDFALVFDRARRQGWRVEHTNGGHVRLVAPDPDMGIVHAAWSPSDRRALKNLLSQLCRRGYRHADV